MSPAHITNIACAILRPAGMSCKYEYDRSRQQFRWNVYRCMRRVASYKKPEDVVEKCEKLVDAGK